MDTSPTATPASVHWKGQGRVGELWLLTHTHTPPPGEMGPRPPVTFMQVGKLGAGRVTTALCAHELAA